jgi:hypothetical protein
VVAVSFSALTHLYHACIARQNCPILSPTFLWYKIVFPSSIPRESHPPFSSTKLCFLHLSQGKGRKIGLHTVLHDDKGISFINFQKRKTNSSSFHLGVVQRRVKKKIKRRNNSLWSVRALPQLISQSPC